MIVVTSDTLCQITGAGNPNTLSVVPPTGCTDCVYINAKYDSRNPSDSTTWVYDGSTWVARP